MNKIDVVSQLRPYQKIAYDKMVKTGSHLVYDDMRLGKTITTLAAIETLEAFPLIIVCPKFALYVWQQEIKRWLDQSAIIYTGKPKEREKKWQEFVSSGCKILITNFAQVEEIRLRSAPSTPTGTPQWQWHGFIADEIHMGGLFNPKSKTFKSVAKLTKTVRNKFLLTGTPYRQGVVDFYAPLHILDRDRFSNYWSYVNRYCITIKDMFGTSIERNPANVFKFREMLKEYMVRRTKEEVFASLPKKQRLPIQVEMNEEQEKVYWELTEELFTMVPDTGELLIVQGHLTLLIRQRQLLACPQVLGLKERGAALDSIIDMSHEQLDEGKPIVIYTPFRKAVPIIEKALRDEYETVAIYKIQGKMTAEEFRDSWMNFQEHVYPRKVMICVIKSGAAFKASAANTGYFLGCEFDFNFNEQAEDRMFDPDTKEPMQIYYPLYKGTVDDLVVAKLNDKKKAANWVIGSDEVFKAMLEKLKGRKASE